MSRIQEWKFALPATPLVKVSYMRDGVKYEAVLSNPRTNDRLMAVMLARNIGLSQVRYVAAMPQRRSA